MFNIKLFSNAIKCVCSFLVKKIVKFLGEPSVPRAIASCFNFLTAPIACLTVAQFLTAAQGNLPGGQNLIRPLIVL
jgi:hypothetical protein